MGLIDEIEAECRELALEASVEALYLEAANAEEALGAEEVLTVAEAHCTAQELDAAKLAMQLKVEHQTVAQRAGEEHDQQLEALRDNVTSLVSDLRESAELGAQLRRELCMSQKEDEEVTHLEKRAELLGTELCDEGSERDAWR